MQKVLYILFFLSTITSCMYADLDAIQPQSVVVAQGNTAIQDQKTVIEYGTLRVFKDSVIRNYTLTNTSEQTLRFSTITSDNQDFFVQIEKDTMALLSRESLRFSVTFSPQLGGTTVGKISFSTNDPAYPVFSFGVKGEGVAVPEIVGNNSPQFDELNDVDLGLTGKATRFRVEIYVEDIYNRINPSELSIKLQPIFDNGDRPTFVIKNPSEITVSEDNKRIEYSFVVRFGESNFIDIENTLILGNGDVSEIYKMRIDRPQGAE